MRPDDANVVGNVHGGIILKMIEEAGCIVCTRHCNKQNGVGQGDCTPCKWSLLYILVFKIFLFKIFNFCLYNQTVSVTLM